MLLNRFEQALMNNPVRTPLKRYVEARRLLRMGGAIPRRAGPGNRLRGSRGVGTEICADSFELFGADSVDAFDSIPWMVGLALRWRLARYGSRVRLWVGDASAIAARDCRDLYDAVVDFGAIIDVPAGGVL